MWTPLDMWNPAAMWKAFETGKHFFSQYNPLQLFNMTTAASGEKESATTTLASLVQALPAELYNEIVSTLGRKLPFDLRPTAFAMWRMANPYSDRSTYRFSIISRSRQLRAFSASLKAISHRVASK